MSLIVKENNKFEVGGVYEKTFICDNDLRPRYKCIKLTKCFATFVNVKSGGASGKEVIRRKIYTCGYGNQKVNTDNYSFAPTISSSRKVN